jgi:thioredoxin reductase (NADPH)
MKSEGQEIVEEFDTVLFAMGRYAVTQGINLDAAGVKFESNGKIKVNDQE